ncbi:MAG: DoxX family protein [Candidatus Omnitrophota bacterium]|jgi:putative oxidoreductase
MVPYVHWLLRLALAGIFFYHGLGKFPVLERFAAMINMPVFVALLVALMETLGAVLILGGGFLNSAVTRAGAVLFVPIMLVAIVKVHWGQWGSMPSQAHPAGGMEFPVIILALSLYFLIRGNNV